MFQFEKGDARVRNLPIDNARNAQFFSIVHGLEEQGIKISCSECKNRLECKDKYAIKIIRNGSLETLNSPRQGMREPNYCALFPQLPELKKLYQTHKKIKDLFDSTYQTQ